MPPARRAVAYVTALALAMSAVLVPSKWLESPGVVGRMGVTPVVVAAMDVPEGKAFDRTSVVVAQWPVPTIPPGSFSAIDSVVGRVARISVFKGEPIVPGRLAPEGTAPGLEVKITPGKRAVGLRINDVAGIAGMIQPNSRVDIMVVMTNDGDGKQVAKLFMSNMRVLAIGPVVQRAEDGRPINSHVATIEVAPDESERLAIAQSRGQIQLVLRGYGDPDSIQTKGANSSDIIAQLKDAPVVKSVQRPALPATPDTLRVKVFRGNSRESARAHRGTGRR